MLPPLSRGSVRPYAWLAWIFLASLAACSAQPATSQLSDLPPCPIRTSEVAFLSTSSGPPVFDAATHSFSVEPGALPAEVLFLARFDQGNLKWHLLTPGGMSIASEGEIQSSGSLLALTEFADQPGKWMLDVALEQAVGSYRLCVGGPTAAPSG